LIYFFVHNLYIGKDLLYHFSFVKLFK